VGCGLYATRRIVSSLVKASKMRTCSFEERHFAHDLFIVYVFVYTQTFSSCEADTTFC
jgi:hypothetical protein